MLNQYTFKIIVRPNHEMMDIQKMQISRKIVTGKVRYEESLQPPSLSIILWELYMYFNQVCYYTYKT